MPHSEITAIDPRSGERLGSYPETPAAEVDGIVARARAAFADPRLADPDRRAAALRAAAAALRADRDELHELCEAESGLPAGRVAGELERTCVQLELFADVVDAGDQLEPIIDLADPDARPVPRPDVRRMLVPIGPVAVFGASNFPFAFGVAGGDTASAWAAGCPVVAKGHPSQPGVNAAVGERLAAAAEEAGLPPGSFAIVQGAATELGEALVDADGVAAVAFTGSLGGGRALFDRAARRPVPIPVYAEMGSVNPAVVTAGALRARAGEVRDALETSITFAAGQLCTKPGVVLVPAGADGDAFVAGLVDAVREGEAGVMLNDRLHGTFVRSLAGLADQQGVRLLTTGAGPSDPGFRHAAAVLEVGATTLAASTDVREECFGPAVLLARYDGEAELLAALAAFDGQLSAAIFAEPDEEAELVAEVSRLLTERVGRLVFDAFPTGVAVTWAMQHGGPYPATTAPGHTSVGLTATRRFMRPVAWQSAPAAVLPPELRDENPRRIWRRVNGRMTDGPARPARG
jgi:NADP-dependent aldehyde dehydrogenase